MDKVDQEGQNYTENLYNLTMDHPNERPVRNPLAVRLKSTRTPEKPRLPKRSLNLKNYGREGADSGHSGYSGPSYGPKGPNNGFFGVQSTPQKIPKNRNFGPSEMTEKLPFEKGISVASSIQSVKLLKRGLGMSSKSQKKYSKKSEKSSKSTKKSHRSRKKHTSGFWVSDFDSKSTATHNTTTNLNFTKNGISATKFDGVMASVSGGVKGMSKSVKQGENGPRNGRMGSGAKTVQSGVNRITRVGKGPGRYRGTIHDTSTGLNSIESLKKDQRLHLMKKKQKPKILAEKSDRACYDDSKDDIRGVLGAISEAGARNLPPVVIGPFLCSNQKEQKYEHFGAYSDEQRPQRVQDHPIDVTKPPNHRRRASKPVVSLNLKNSKIEKNERDLSAGTYTGANSRPNERFEPRYNLKSASENRIGVEDDSFISRDPYGFQSGLKHKSVVKRAHRGPLASNMSDREHLEPKSSLTERKYEKTNFRAEDSILQDDSIFRVQGEPERATAPANRQNYPQKSAQNVKNPKNENESFYGQNMSFQDDSLLHHLNIQPTPASGDQEQSLHLQKGRESVQTFQEQNNAFEPEESFSEAQGPLLDPRDPHHTPKDLEMSLDRTIHQPDTTYNQSRILDAETLRDQNSILEANRRVFQRADMNDSHMNMSLSVLSNQSKIQKFLFKKPENPTRDRIERKIKGLSVDDGLHEPDFMPQKNSEKPRNRQKNLTQNAGFGALEGQELSGQSKSIMLGAQNKSNMLLMKQISEGYLQNVGKSFRRVLLNAGSHLDEQRELQEYGRELKQQGDDESLRKVKKMVHNNDFWNIGLFLVGFLILVTLIGKVFG